MGRVDVSVLACVIGAASIAAPTPLFAQGPTTPAGFTAISAGGEHTCAVTSAGSLWCWGDNTYGQLGDGTTTTRNSMVSVQGLSSGVTAVTAGMRHTCALTDAGGVKCWGANAAGQLGDGTTDDRLTPVDVIGLTSGVLVVSAGASHSCAVTGDGGVKCWGGNGFGQLGDGTTTTRLTPVDVSGLTSGNTAVSAGGYHTCALVRVEASTTNGGLKCWGYNSYGQLGDFTQTDRWTPVEVNFFPGITSFTQYLSGLSAGHIHTCVTADSAAKCWGYNLYGQLGNGTTSNSPTPVTATGVAAGGSSVAAGYLQSYAVGFNNTAKSWGSNLYGSLGDGTTTNRSTSVLVSGMPEGVVRITGGGAPVDPFTGYIGGHACALTTAGEARCWGANNRGQLGDGTYTNRTTPVALVSAPIFVTQPVSRTVVGGGTQSTSFTVALLVVPGNVGYRWQVSRDGGTSWLDLSNTPAVYSGVTTSTLMLMTVPSALDGYQYRCVVTNDVGSAASSAATLHVVTVGITAHPVGQTVYAGQNATFTVGTVSVPPPPNVQWQISTDDGASFTNLAEAPPYSGTTSPTLIVTSVTPVLHRRQYRAVASSGAASAVSGAATLIVLPIGLTKVAAGSTHTCGLTSAGGVRCWGNNFYGQAGDGTRDGSYGGTRAVPGDVVGLTSGVVAVTAGSSYTCALTSAGGVKCWGWNRYGQLGDGTLAEYRLTPVDVTGLTSGVVAVAAGFLDHTCAVTSAGAVKCWGKNASGQLGDGTTTDRRTPVDVVGLSSGIIAVTTGTEHTCALSSSGGVKCWGSNGSGRLGNGDTSGSSTTPVNVTGLSSGVTAVTAGGQHTCAMLSGGGVKCWGNGDFFQTGTGVTGTSWPTPVDVVGLSSGVAAVAAGGQHTCVLMIGGGAKCWGGNSVGQLGDGTFTTRSTPVDVIGLPAGLLDLDVASHSCVVTSAGAAYCWGNGSFGQLGDGTQTGGSFDHPVPGLVLTTTADGPAISVQPIDRSISAGQSTTFTVTAPSATRYQWLVSPPGATWWSTVYNTNPGSGFISPYSGNGTATLTVTSAPASLNGNRYRCVVANAAGVLMSASATLSVPSPPAPSTSLVASPSGLQRIWLTWTTSSTAVSYTIKRGTLSGGETTLASVASPSYFDTAVAGGQTYYYVVSAVNAAGESANSNEASATARSASAAATPLDFDGDGKADPTIVRASSGAWISAMTAYPNAPATVLLGAPGDVPASGDYDGDTIADAAIYRPSSGVWQILSSSTGASASIQWGLPGDVPVPGDYDGDGKTDPAVYRPSSGLWYILQSSTGVAFVRQWGLPVDVPVPADYDGDGTTDVAVYHPSGGGWFILQSSTHFTASLVLNLGAGVDRPVPGDYDGDGRAEPAVYRPSDQTWRWLRSGTLYFVSTPVQWGLPLDAPVPADYDGDGMMDVAVYRKSAAAWFVRRSSNPSVPFSTPVAGSTASDTSLEVALPVIAVVRPASDARRQSDVDGDGQSDLTVFRPGTGTWYSLTSGSGYANSVTTQWGLEGDIPVAGDYDGDGRADRAVFRPPTGMWYVLTSSSGFTQFTATQWGLPADTPVPGDYDGDGRTDLAVYRPDTGYWYMLTSSSNYTASAVFQWGLNGDTPVPNDYDGDGRTDLAVYRPQAGQWYILLSSANFTASQMIQWDLTNDTPVSGDYDGDGKADPAVFRSSSAQWHILLSSSGYTVFRSYEWGAPGDVAVPGDYDGDGMTDIAVYHPPTGVWSVVSSRSGDATNFTIQWGLPSDVPTSKR